MSSSFASECLSTVTPLTPADLLVDLPPLSYERFVLPNGLVLIVHENHDVPQVAVHVFYRVGAKDEPEGQHGFAHLFEHLMFSGSANLPGNYVTHLQNAGATELNATTSPDVTHFFECVPTGTLEFALFAESDRMGAFADSLTQAALDVEREVVFNEMDESVQQQYGRVHGTVLEHLFPAEHPYAHTILGREADLRNATLADAKAWFARYYRPNNAVLSLAGAIDAKQALEKVTAWFAGIAPGEPVDRCSQRLVAPSGARRVEHFEWGASPQLRMIWVLPPVGHSATVGMHLIAEILTGTSESRLSQRMIRELRLASDVYAYVEPGMLASHFNITVALMPGESAAAAEACVREVLQKLGQQGPDEGEIERCQRDHFMAAVYGQGDNSSIAKLLGSSEVQLGHPHAYHQLLSQTLNLDAVQLRDIVREWIAADGLVLRVSDPDLQWEPVPPQVRVPPVVQPTSIRALPAAQKLQLSNCLQVILVERPGQPVVSTSLLVDAASRHDPAGQHGLAALVGGLIGAGAGARDAAAVKDELQALGASFDTASGFQAVALRMHALKSTFDSGMALFSELVREPWFRAEEFEALRQSTLDGAAQKSGLLVVLPALVFPAQHPYAKPGFAYGTATALQRLTVADVERFHQLYYRPDNARLLVVGDVRAEHLRQHLEVCFSDWLPGATREPLSKPSTVKPEMGKLALAHYPDSALATISVVFSVPPQGQGTDAELFALYKLLGDSFASRMNQGLREKRQFTYGVNGLFSNPPGYCFVGFELTVANSNILPVVEAILAELLAIVSTQPFSADEVESVCQGELRRMSTMGGSLASLRSLFENQFLFGLAEDHWVQMASSIERLDLEGLNQFSAQHLQLNNSVWWISGDVRAVDETLRELVPLAVRNIPGDVDKMFE